MRNVHTDLWFVCGEVTGGWGGGGGEPSVLPVGGNLGYISKILSNIMDSDREFIAELKKQIFLQNTKKNSPSLSFSWRLLFLDKLNLYSQTYPCYCCNQGPLCLTYNNVICKSLMKSLENFAKRPKNF